MLTKYTAFVLAAAVTASPVAAADTAQTNQAAAKPAAKEKRYCLAEAVTGTRMATKVCKTKADWDKDGIDIAAEAPKK